MTPRETIIKNYVDFFNAGSKHPTDLKYGVEAEHFVIDKNTKKAIPYLGENGVCQLLSELKPHFVGEYLVDGSLLGLYSDEAEISLEPGSQLEISITASDDIAAIAAIYQKYHDIITTILAGRDQELVTIGYQPATLVRDITLLPRKRYTFMDDHFKKTGDRGINMMRGTASCQVVIDYTDEKDFISKFQNACLLTPLFALISSNTPMYEGKPNANPLIRTEIWRGVDPARCGIPPVTFEPDFSFAKYAEYIIGQAAIFEVIKDNSPNENKSSNIGNCIIKNNPSKQSDRLVADVLTQNPVWDDDYLLYLSLVFPDVRLRQYIEIRVADSMPAARTFAYMALIKGLFLDMPSLNQWLSKFPHNIKAIKDAENAIMDKGIEAIVYGEPVADLLKQMLELSSKSLNPAEKTILKHSLFHLSHDKTSPNRHG